MKQHLRRGARAAASRPSSTAPTPSRTFPFKVADLGCDYYGTSLHKWLLAPIGTGFLYVRRENIAALWPLTPAVADKKRGHPQVRGDRHAPGGQSQRDRRGADLPRGHRHRAQGGAAALPARPLGEAPGRTIRRSASTPTCDPAQSCAIGTVQIIGAPTAKVVRTAVGASGASSPRRSCTRNTKACASRRTSTRRSTRSTRSRRRWKRSRAQVTDARNCGRRNADVGLTSDFGLELGILDSSLGFWIGAWDLGFGISGFIRNTP